MLTVLHCFLYDSAQGVLADLSDISTIAARAEISIVPSVHEAGRRSLFSGLISQFASAMCVRKIVRQVVLLTPSCHFDTRED